MSRDHLNMKLWIICRDPTSLKVEFQKLRSLEILNFTHAFTSLWLIITLSNWNWPVNDWLTTEPIKMLIEDDERYS